VTVSFFDKLAIKLHSMANVLQMYDNCVLCFNISLLV